MVVMSTRVAARPTGVALSSLSIVLPCHDEAENVAAAVHAAGHAAARCAADYEIVVVDDGSTDATAIIVAALADTDPHVRLVVHGQNRGYGHALRAGIQMARGDWILLTDADLQFDLGELEDFLPHTEHADLIVGWRILRRDPLYRRANARVWNWLVRWVFDLHVRDVDCAFKLVRRETLQACELTSDGAMISTELLVKSLAAGARLRELGVHHRMRIAGRAGGSDPRVVARAVHELVRLRRSLRPQPGLPAT
jgi:glycosyltransferase involved in cell wall biosynthesis